MVVASQSFFKSRWNATDAGREAMVKNGGSSFTVWETTPGFWSFKVFA